MRASRPITSKAQWVWPFFLLPPSPPQPIGQYREEVKLPRSGDVPTHFAFNPSHLDLNSWVGVPTREPISAFYEGVIPTPTLA